MIKELIDEISALKIRADRLYSRNTVKFYDNSLDRDRHTHTGDYREGWDDCIDKIAGLLESYKPKVLDKPDTMGDWFIQPYLHGEWVCASLDPSMEVMFLNGVAYETKNYNGKWIKPEVQ